MSLVQLESFTAVAEEALFGRAARRFHVPQPPLTRRIRRLEEELGTPLFERTLRGMRLLPSGHRLLPWARAILDVIDEARTAVHEHESDGAETRSPRSGRRTKRLRSLP